MQKILNLIKLFKEYLNGDFAYKNYLKHQSKNHPQELILSKKQFLQKRMNEKGNKMNRCC